MYSFNEIIGNDLLISNLRNIVASKKVSHAFIFNGQKGLGKSLIAKTFAKTLQCEKGGNEPCNSCISCKTFDSNNHPDVIYVRPTNTKSIGVDAIRDTINKNLEIKPFKYPYKIFIIEAAHTMTVQAQNALLKSIEEPPSYGIFILISDNYKNLLFTILSRCVLFKLKPLLVSQVKKYLIEKENVPLQEAETYSIFSQGNIGRVLKLKDDEDFLNLREKIIELAKNIKKQDINSALNTSKELANFKDNINDVLDIFYAWYRDLIVYKETNSYIHLLQQDKKDIIIREVNSYTVKGLNENLDAVWQAKIKLLQNGNFQLIMDIMLLKLRCS